jgi:hypothetical protein
MIKPITVFQHLVYGLHSNIPLCCILNWIWDKIRQGDNWNEWVQKYNRYNKDAKVPAGYVQCHYHHKRIHKPNKIHRCLVTPYRTKISCYSKNYMARRAQINWYITIIDHFKSNSTTPLLTPVKHYTSK